MTEKFECTNRSRTIRGKVYGYKQGIQKPAVILSHGFLANQKMCITYAKLLAQKGFAAFTFDFCGGSLGSKSSGKSEEMSLSSELSDLEAVLHYVKSLPYISDSHVSLLGCSQGGLVSMMLARKIPDQIQGLMLFYPALCIPDDARRGKMMFYQFDPDHIPDLLGSFPMKLGGHYAKEVIHMNVYNEIGGFNGPVLYLHGTNDLIVDISYARQAHALYPNAVYMEIEGAGHFFRGKFDEIAKNQLALFAENLPK